MMRMTERDRYWNHSRAKGISSFLSKEPIYITLLYSHAHMVVKASRNSVELLEPKELQPRFSASAGTRRDTESRVQSTDDNDANPCERAQGERSRHRDVEVTTSPHSLGPPRILPLY